MLKNATASMIIVWSLVILLVVLGFVLDIRFLAAALLVLGLYIGSVADANSSQRI